MAYPHRGVVQKKRPPMANSDLEHRYAGKNASRYYCSCGKPTYPESIWEPIIKVNTNRGTAGSMSWEYHASCVRKVLNGEIIESDGGAKLALAPLVRSRHCIVTGESLPRGTIAVWMTHAYHNRMAVTTPAQIEKLLATEPKPIECAAANVVFDWALNHRDWPVEIVRKKYRSKGAHRKRTFDSLALELLEFLETLESIQHQVGLELSENVFDYIRELCAHQPTRFHVNADVRNAMRHMDRFTIRDFVHNYLMFGGGLFNRYICDLDARESSKTQKRLHRRRLEACITHGFDLIEPEKLDQMSLGTCLEELGEIVLKNEETKRGHKALRDPQESISVLKFLCNYDRDEEVPPDEMALHLVGEKVLVRQLCKHLQDHLYA